MVVLRSHPRGFVGLLAEAVDGKAHDVDAASSDLRAQLLGEQLAVGVELDLGRGIVVLDVAHDLGHALVDEGFVGQEGPVGDAPAPGCRRRSSSRASPASGGIAHDRVLGAEGALGVALGHGLHLDVLGPLRVGHAPARAHLGAIAADHRNSPEWNMSASARTTHRRRDTRVRPLKGKPGVGASQAGQGQRKTKRPLNRWKDPWPQQGQAGLGGPVWRKTKLWAASPAACAPAGSSSRRRGRSGLRGFSTTKAAPWRTRRSAS